MLWHLTVEPQRLTSRGDACMRNGRVFAETQSTKSIRSRAT
jgi:hypothetical protein